MSGLLYSPLSSPGSFRVLILEAGDFADPICTRLIEADVDTMPSYTALSYVWGDPNNTAAICCNKHSVAITVNLAAALRRLRQTDKAVIVWADALCINQCDAEEKSVQVSLMGRIYSTAETVAAYIGEDDADSAAAVEMIALFTGLQAKIGHHPPNKIADLVLNCYLQRENGLTDLPPEDDVRWEAFDRLYKRTYFSRVWMIQEIALAAADPVVILGRWRLAWSEVATAANLYHFGHIQDSRVGTQDTLSSNLELMEAYRDEPRTFSLEQSLLQVNEFACTDPRDRIYALYGLACDYRGADGQPVFETDYKLPPELVFRNTAARIIERGSLTPLSHAFCQSTPNLPSWVPDWTTSDTDIGSLLTGFGYEGHRAAAGAPLCCRFPPDDSAVLLIAGQSAAVVGDWLSAPITAEDMSQPPECRTPGALPAVWRHVRGVLGEGGTAYPAADGCTVAEAFWRTILTGVGWMRKRLPAAYHVHFLSFWRESRLWDAAAEAFRANGGQPVPAPGPRDVQAILARLFWNRDQYAACARRELRKAGIPACVCPRTAGGIASRPGCLPCGVVANADNPLMRALVASGEYPRLREDDPSVAWENDDEFVAEWFRRLRTDEAEPIRVVDSQWGLFAESFARSLGGKRFFITTNGLLGTGPPTMSPGDTIALLSGAQVPYVLRPTAAKGNAETRWRLVGEVYVHGMMDGEHLRRGSDGEPAWADFAIV